jgi:hypothetical protein
MFPQHREKVAIRVMEGSIQYPFFGEEPDFCWRVFRKVSFAADEENYEIDCAAWLGSTACRFKPARLGVAPLG